MKLRIDPKKISFRLNLGELDLLLTQGDIMERTNLPQGCLIYKIICLPAGSPPIFTAGKGNFTLSLAQDVIENHRGNLPSLAGIISEFPSREGGIIQISLEVNLKKKIRRRSKS
ncbi:hypothetical protein MNBD_ALPHA03-531 [hydrothermal vent metagenome]|uniref:Uncharacterized protein n=1 Tax=hydrothermal vent metagenome TaxID=652676 RepID=A0A3B1BFY2_9ZZZZ